MDLDSGEWANEVHEQNEKVKRTLWFLTNTYAKQRTAVTNFEVQMLYPSWDTMSIIGCPSSVPQTWKSIISSLRQFHKKKKINKKWNVFFLKLTYMLKRQTPGHLHLISIRVSGKKSMIRSPVTKSLSEIVIYLPDIWIIVPWNQTNQWELMPICMYAKRRLNKVVT